MSSKIRIKGRILINGNITLLSMVLLCFALIILLSNFSVLIYETTLSERITSFSAQYESIVDFAVSVVLILFSFGIYSVIKLGTDRFFLRRAQKKGACAKDVFYYLHPMRSIGAVGFMLKLVTVKTFLFLFSVLPFSASISLALYLLDNGVSALVLFFLLAGSIAFLLSGMVFYVNVTDTLFLSKYYFIQGECLSFSHAISSSQQNMKNKTALLKKIRAGFCGWFALSALIIPIGYVWSYYNQTLAVASENFMNE